MANKIKAVVLAAGKSTRMKSEKSKVLHKILGKEIINYLLDSLVACGIAEQDIVVVVGDNHAEIAGAVTRQVVYAVQQEQLGTAHALLAAGEYIAGHDGELLVAGRGQSLHHGGGAAKTDRQPPPRAGPSAHSFPRSFRAIRHPTAASSAMSRGRSGALWRKRTPIPNSGRSAK